MADNLREVVREYLNENGIKAAFFAKYIGEHPSIVSMWFKGIRNLTSEKMQLVHKFLNESHKSADKIMEE